MTSLDGMKAVVTGGARGIGRAIVDAFAARGARVVTLDICSEGDGIDCDVACETDVTRAMEEALAVLGGLDVVVCNAGIVIEKSLLDTSAADFDRVLAVNLRGTFLVGREAARHFLACPRSAPGRIVTIASELAHLGRTWTSPYCASKAGVIALTRSWARELAPHVLVNAVAPGPTDTAMLQSERDYDALKATASGIPLGRLGSPQDIAGAVAFLASADAQFMTGSVVDVNGGAAMY